MPPQVPQEFLEDAFAAWERLRRWTDINNYLCALRSSPFSQYPHHEKDPYSLRLARRVTEVVESLEGRVDVAVDSDITPRGALLALAADVRLSLSHLPLLFFCERANIFTSPHLTSNIPTDANITAVVNTHFPASASASASASTAAAGGGGAAKTKTRINNAFDFATNDAWAVAIRQRSVSGVVMMEGIHVLTCPGVQLRIEMTIERLRGKIRQELVGNVNCEAFSHTPEELQALRATTMLLDDFETFYRRLLATFSCLRAMNSLHVPVALMPVVYEQYYQMGEWVLETEFTARARQGAYVQSFDPKKLRAMVRRSEGVSPWGLRFGDGGKLIGVSAVVRSASSAGQKLHQFIESTKGGLTILSYNLKEVDLKNSNAEQVTEILSKLSRKQKRIYLKFCLDPSAKPAVEELAFYAIQAGQSPPHRHQQEGEGERKEQLTRMEFPYATLVLCRDNCSVSWDMAITRDLIVMSVPVGILSAEANAFFSSHPKQVRIRGINGIEVTSAIQLEALSSTVNTIVLDLYTIQLPLPQKMEIKAGKKSIENKRTNKKTTDVMKSRNTRGEKPLTEFTKAKLTFTKAQSLVDVEEKQKQELNIIDCAVDETKLKRGSASEFRNKTASGTLISNSPTCAPAKELRSSEGKSSNIDEFKKSLNNKKTKSYELHDVDMLALKEEPLVSITSRNYKTTLHDRGDTTFGGLREESNVENPFCPTLVNNRESLKNFTPLLDKKKKESSMQSSDVVEVASPTTLPFQRPQQIEHDKQEEKDGERSSFDAMTDSGSLQFPNNVTLDLLTLDEMIISRQSADKKWGLSMETVGQEPNRSIRVTGLPLLMDSCGRQHKFYSLFNSHKGNWRISSVNGTPATRLPEVIDVMKHALRMQIKFHKRW